MSDGTFFFRGEGILATIQRNGDVEFKDRPLSDPELRAEAPLGATPAMLGENTKSTFSIIAALRVSFDAAGPHSAERRWFLARTELFRDSLARKEAKRQLETLSRTLHRIWTAAEVSFARRRRETYELWDSLADDELGARGRALILTFVRARCPPGSACAFTEDELRFAHRSSRHRERFAP